MNTGFFKACSLNQGALIAWLLVLWAWSGGLLSWWVALSFSGSILFVWAVVRDVVEQQASIARGNQIAASDLEQHGPAIWARRLRGLNLHG